MNHPDVDVVVDAGNNELTATSEVSPRQGAPSCWTQVNAASAITGPTNVR